MAWAHSGLHGDELDEDLGGDLNAGVAGEETGELLLLVPRHQLDCIVIVREGAQDVYERVSGDDGLVCFIVGALGVILEYVVEFLFEVGDRLAVPSIGFRLNSRVSRVASRRRYCTYRRHVWSIEVHEVSM